MISKRRHFKTSGGIIMKEPLIFLTLAISRVIFTLFAIGSISGLLFIGYRLFLVKVTNK
ncbi:hypothetical protein IV83_GL001124 [Pediococcus inopinatus]|nr:hypothetical protein IV83_GL001124 [Pediococcus inopinatus]